MTLFVTADTHFNHRGILAHCEESRPYASVDEMNEAMVEAWNSVVGPRDTVVHLGDFGFASGRGRRQGLDDIFKSLNGHKELVRGNHDEQNPAVELCEWERVDDLRTLRQDGFRAVLCHYPLATWKHAHRGYLMLHGHSHGTLKQEAPNRWDVGWDVWREPVPFERFCEMRTEYEPVDHHGGK